MNIGDKVRLLHFKGEGIIRRVIDEKMVEVELEEGFSMPTLKSEVVLIAKEEAIQFKTNQTFQEDNQTNNNTTSSKLLFADKGIFVAFFAINDKRHSLYFINNTDFELPFTITEESDQTYQGLSAGCLQPKSMQIVHEVTLENFEKWGTYIFQILYLRKGTHYMREPLVKRMKFRASTFFKSKQNAPVLNKTAYTFQIDRDEKDDFLDIAQIEEVKIDPQKLMEQMFEKKGEIPLQINVSKPEAEVDLHIEKITNDYGFMDNASILKLQLDLFEKKLENAIASGMKEIIFIHGIGNGLLRNEIHKRLSKNTEIKFFEDAKKEKFGYGATLVKMK